MRGWEGVWEGKEEGVKTGNFAKVPSSVTCAAATERKRTSVARVTERQKKQGKEREREQEEDCHSLASSPGGLEMSKHGYT